MTTAQAAPSVVKGWKILTHDYRPPLQGGDPVCDGTLPYELPKVNLDRSDNECSHGWNFCREIRSGWKIAGMWRTGRPCKVIRVEALGDHVERGDKLRAEQLGLIRLATDEEIYAAIESM